MSSDTDGRLITPHVLLGASLQRIGPATAAELAADSGLPVNRVREWLRMLVRARAVTPDGHGTASAKGPMPYRWRLLRK